MKLYGFPPSPRTWAVRAVAAQLGVPLDFEFVDLTKGQQHAPNYRAINPTGRAPTLVDGDFKLWEAMAIMHYLAGQKPTALWPDDMRIRADIVRWQSWKSRTGRRNPARRCCSSASSSNSSGRVRRTRRSWPARSTISRATPRCSTRI